jgi:hypothetical protein
LLFGSQGYKKVHAFISNASGTTCLHVAVCAILFFFASINLKVPVQDYYKVLSEIKPDVAVAPADVPPAFSSRKRLQKSVERSLKLLDQTVANVKACFFILPSATSVRDFTCGES